MKTLSDATIADIKQTISLLRLVEAAGFEVKKHGRDHAICCPFHDDKTPSLVISRDSNLFHCFGCEASGSVIDWVMKTQGVSFRHACAILQDTSSLAANPVTPVKKSTVRSLDNPLTAKDDAALLRQVVDYYHDTLKSTPEAVAYLEQRGLASRELIDTFKLGYANRTLGYRLPNKNRKAGSAIREQLQRIGIYRASGHEHFSGSLVVPVMDADGNITEIYGRKLIDKLRKGTPKHCYLPNAHCGIWNVNALTCGSQLILCEALMDAMTFWIQGFKHVTASYGANGFTDEMLTALTDSPIKQLYIAYDADDMGNKAAEKLAERLAELPLEILRVRLPWGEDANSFARKSDNPQAALAEVLRNAEWLSGKPQTATNSPAIKNATALLYDDCPIEQHDHEITATLGDRFYRIRGLDKNNAYEQLRINLLVRFGQQFYVDHLDLYLAKQRTSFVKQACIETGLQEAVLNQDLGRLLLKLETLQDTRLTKSDEDAEKIKPMTAAEEAAALTLLQDENLTTRILQDIKRIGIMGEENNSLVAYLACVSRLLDAPLAIIIQSTSAAGKSALMQAILNLMPSEQLTQYSAMTGQSVFYLGETNLEHSILAIAEEEGAQNASYALKLLQSDGELSIASTGKDAQTGRMITHEYKVQGPVMLFLTTTAIDIDEELLNRCLVLSVDESQRQTQAIHMMQRGRQTLTGLLTAHDKQQLLTLHQNAQRLLKPMAVVNPFAEQLTFLSHSTRTRRDHMKYLTLISSITLLHQYQREHKTVAHHGNIITYIETTKADIQLANDLTHAVLGHSLDELPLQTRRLLQQIAQMVKSLCDEKVLPQTDIRFTRKHIRDYSRMGNTQLKIHCHRLEEMEYLLVHRGKRGQSFEYELLYDTTLAEQKQALGLINPNILQYDEKKSGANPNKSGLNASLSGSSRGQVAPKSGDSRGIPIPLKSKAINGLAASEAQTAKNALL